jgi:hypothetical protein
MLATVAVLPRSMADAATTFLSDDFRYWHEADMPGERRYVRYWGEKRTSTKQAVMSPMTQAV